MFAGQGDFAVSSLVRAVRAVDTLSRAVGEVFDEIDPVAVGRGLPRLGPWLLGSAPPSGRDLAEAPTGSVQLALFGASMAVHRALCRCHGAPEATVGVSFGEIAALTAVGVFSVADGARIAHDLARVLADCPGGLTLLACSEQTAGALLELAGAPDVAVACVNDERETVVSGPLEQLAAVEACAGERAVPAARLRLPFASHHPALGAAAERFAAAVRHYGTKAAGRPVYSAVAGRPYTGGDDIPGRLADCLIRPARLPEVLRQAARRHAPAVFLESGPGSALSRNAQRVLTGTTTAAHAPLDGTGFPWLAGQPERISQPGGPPCP
ncbi:acyltransferase domain-containing protein [Catenulispora sp. NF23]|uniref:acyltransferase domain-containing protein n=1 Tax=Catenulispora pinistramenti TaxID=2705254 RepID=UPI001BA6F7A8|nr:acyltransferase domain-containing protein [Catenulispora pinistramenti]MBS2535452.1 acyltransferase domain-containing protein [Catenulispora pinistramenti]